MCAQGLLQSHSNCITINFTFTYIRNFHVILRFSYLLLFYYSIIHIFSPSFYPLLRFYHALILIFHCIIKSTGSHCILYCNFPHDIFQLFPWEFLTLLFPFHFYLLYLCISFVWSCSFFRLQSVQPAPPTAICVT